MRPKMHHYTFKEHFLIFKDVEYIYHFPKLSVSTCHVIYLANNPARMLILFLIKFYSTPQYKIKHKTTMFNVNVTQSNGELFHLFYQNYLILYSMKSGEISNE